MNGVTLLIIAVVVLAAGYLLYGRWLQKTWGIDPQALTPAKQFEDDKDYVPTDRLTVFAHQFSSICGAGPVTGPIIAVAFGWLPAFLWILVGGVFFGAVQDFTALYASVRNQGKSMGLLIEKYIGNYGRRLFLLFCWLFTMLVVAAFTDMVAGTFVMGATEDVTYANGATATINIAFIVAAVVMGLVTAKLNIRGIVKFVVAIVLFVASFAVGMVWPIEVADKVTWDVAIMVYLFFASCVPMQYLKQPRDYLCFIVLIGMVIFAFVGVIVYNPAIQVNAFNGFKLENGNMLFPVLFVTIACGAVSGFHSLVSTGTSSKTVSNERDMLPVGYGSMVLESLVAVLALICVATVATADGDYSSIGTPFNVFSTAVASFMERLGLPIVLSQVFMTMAVSTLALSSLDAVARIGAMSFSELWLGDKADGSDVNAVRRFLGNRYVATLLVLIPGFALALGGYNNIWSLFGSANQLLAAMVLIALSVFLKATGRKGLMLVIPSCFMLVVVFVSLVTILMGIVPVVGTPDFNFLTHGLQLIFGVLLLVLGVIIAVSCFKKRADTAFGSEKEEPSIAAGEPVAPEGGAQA